MPMYFQFSQKNSTTFFISPVTKCSGATILRPNVSVVKNCIGLLGLTKELFLHKEVIKELGFSRCHRSDICMSLLFPFYIPSPVNYSSRFQLLMSTRCLC